MDSDSSSCPCRGTARAVADAVFAGLRAELATTGTVAASGCTNAEAWTPDVRYPNNAPDSCTVLLRVTPGPDHSDPADRYNVSFTPHASGMPAAASCADGILASLIPAMRKHLPSRARLHGAAATVESTLMFKCTDACRWTANHSIKLAYTPQ